MARHCLQRVHAGRNSQLLPVPARQNGCCAIGIDTSRFDELEGQGFAAFRNMYALPQEKIVFSVGRVVFEKGLHLLVKAMPSILAQEPSTKVVIAGKGPELEALRSSAWSLGVGEKVLLTGFISDEDRDKLFKVASCAVFPSR